LPGTPSGFFKAKPIFEIIDSFALQNSENSARSVDKERNKEGKLQLLYELVSSDLSGLEHGEGSYPSYSTQGFLHLVDNSDLVKIATIKSTLW
jgi:hypothetical protein